MALGFAVGARGADHNRSGAYEVDFSEKVDRRHVTLDAVHLAIETEDKAALMDSLILCKFLRGVLIDFHGEAAEMLRNVTGWDVTADELRETARRVVSAKRQFNLIAGWTPAEDTLPERFLNTPLPNDPEASLSRERLDGLVADIIASAGGSFPCSSCAWTSAGRIFRPMIRADSVDGRKRVSVPYRKIRICGARNCARKAQPHRSCNCRLVFTQQCGSLRCTA